MATITAESEIRAPLDRVWDIISDIDSEPRYWKGTRSVSNKRRDGDVVVREITLAFRDKVCEQRVRITPKESVVAEFTRGIIKGSKEVRVTAGAGGTTVVRVTWEIAMTGLMGMFTGAITGHVRSGTEMALAAIKAEAESHD